jgi:hypothetical protein
MPFSVKQTIALLVPLLLASCGQEKKKSKQPPAPITYESCLAQEKLYIAGHCYDGNGLRGADLRTLLFDHAPFLESLAKDQLEICVLTEPWHAGRQDLETDIRRSIMSWIEPLKSVSYSMPRSIEFVYPLFTKPESFDNFSAAQKCPATADATIVYLDDLTGTDWDEEDRAFAKVEEKEIWLSHKSLRPGTILHEFGHIFGLAFYLGTKCPYL